MPLIAGVDSSTQSTKVEIRDLATGEIVASGAAEHPSVIAPRSEQDPESWWTAFGLAWTRAGEPDVESISVGGQQHGMVALDADDRAVHRAKLWNDTESSDDAARLVAALGGPSAWADAVGSVPVAAFTITKLAWLRRTHPDAWSRIAHVMLPHDYVTHRLTGMYTTDRGDASGTGYWSSATGYRDDLLGLVDPDRSFDDLLPAVLGPLDQAGRWGRATVAPGTGDNMAAALGVGLRRGDAVISIGTSGTVYAVSEAASRDPSGHVAGFADATGRFLPLVCTSNATKVLDATRRILGVDHADFDALALAAEMKNGPVMLPYFDGERTPNRPDSRGIVAGLRSDVTREQFARAAVDGVVCGLLDGLDALRRHADLTGRVILVGGGARSVAVQRVIAGSIELPVLVSDVDEAVATGAAVQAAAVLEQIDHAVVQERWGLGGGVVVDPVDVGDMRERFARLRDGVATDPLTSG